jgi:hypothetical protein
MRDNINIIESPGRTPPECHPPQERVPVAVACAAFRKADATAASANAGPSNIAAVKALGTALIKASLPLTKAHADPGLAHDLGLAGTVNLAIAVGFMPDGPAASYNLAAKEVNTVGADCKAMGY